MVERFNGIEEVVSSILIGSTIFSEKVRESFFLKVRGLFFYAFPAPRAFPPMSRPLQLPRKKLKNAAIYPAAFFRLSIHSAVRNGKDNPSEPGKRPAFFFQLLNFL